MNSFEYTEILKNRNVSLKEYIDEKFKNNDDYSHIYVRINGKLRQLSAITDFDKDYLKCLVDGFGVIPNGAVIYLQERNSMLDKSKIKVEILKNPTEQDWLWCKQCTLNTVGKKLKSSTNSVDLEWKKKLLASEHSPIRELWFGIKLTIPYFISVHIVRHHIGCNHYVSTQRDDRHPERAVSREELPQGQLVSHILSINAQELMFFMRKRLCNQADPLMRYVANLIKQEVLKVNPEFEGLLVPLCEYRNNKCTEMFPCEKAKLFN